MKYDLNINTSIGKDGLPPGMYPVIIYQLIRQYSNENNKLSIDDIMDTLEAYWKGDRQKPSSKTNLKKTLKRNLVPLLYFDSNIHAEYANEDPFCIDSGDSIGKIKYIWYEQELSTTDLQLLSDAIVYAKHMSNNRRLEIMEKLMHITGQAFTAKSSWLNSVLKDAMDLSVSVHEDLYHNLEYINAAIANKQCLAFDFVFSGQHGKSYKVQSYAGISPYKIFHDDGIYFMVASRNIKTDKQNQLPKTHNRTIPIIYIEIHKMKNLRTDFNNTYLDIEETDGAQKSLQNFISSGYHPLTHEAIPFRFKEDMFLRVNARGLDVLIDHFGNRMKITKRKEKDDSYAGPSPELAYTYYVTIKEVARNDWYELLILLLRYPASELELIEPQNLLRIVFFQMRNRLERLEKNDVDT